MHTIEIFLPGGPWGSFTWVVLSVPLGPLTLSSLQVRVWFFLVAVLLGLTPHAHGSFLTRAHDRLHRRRLGTSVRYLFCLFIPLYYSLFFWNFCYVPRFSVQMNQLADCHAILSRGTDRTLG